jgi:YD repeat-containing protein
VTTYAYDNHGRQTTIVDNATGTSVTTTTFYDTLGRVGATLAPSADGTAVLVTRTTYNPDGSVATVIANCTTTGTTPPATEVDALACEGAGTKDAATNLVTTNTYKLGTLVAVTSPNPSATTGSDAGTVTTQYAYDDASRLCRVVENTTAATDLTALVHPCTSATQDAGTATANVSTRYSYDGAGNLAAMIDAAGHTTTYAYDAAGTSTGRTDRLVRTLFLAFPAHVEGGCRLVWPNADRDFWLSDPVKLEADMDLWQGDEVLDLADPWLLVTLAAWTFMRDAGLTGLHVASVPALRYSKAGESRARLGELARRNLPPFCVARPERGVHLANQDGDEREWSSGDELRFWDWEGDDFTHCRLGLVVSERARSVLLSRNVPNMTFLVASPR